MSGEWLIRQQPPRAGHRDGGYHVERVTIETTASGSADPSAETSPHGIMFRHADGRTVFFPWANILRAEYRPHTQP